MEIKFLSSVIFVRDIQAARHFYEGLLGQKVLMDHGPNVGFEGGFALWQVEHADQMLFGKSNRGHDPLGKDNLELYFETSQLDSAIKKLEESGTPFVHSLVEQPWGQRVVRVYDPDRHIVEVGEPMPAVIQRFAAQGMTSEQIAGRTSMPLEIVRAILQSV